MSVTLDDIIPAAWNGANCLGIDTDVFMEPDLYSSARRICHNCDLQFNCFAHAAHHKEWGTWGGAWFGFNLRNGKAARRGNGPSRRAVERHAHTLMRYMRLTTEEYVVRFGPPGSVTAFRKALTSLRGAKVA